MSVRVNLLPREALHRQAAARQRRLVAGLFVLLLAVLAAVYVWQHLQVRDAQDRLATAEAERDELALERAELQPYADLEQQRTALEGQLTSSMGSEASIAGVMQDVAAVMPDEAQIDDLSVTLADVPAGGIERPSWGQLALSGRTLASHAPGVEELVLELDRMVSFHDLFVSSSTLEADDEDNDEDEAVVTFSVEAELGPEILTGRYLQGLPEAMR